MTIAELLDCLTLMQNQNLLLQVFSNSARNYHFCKKCRVTSEEMRQERTLVSTSSSTSTRFVDPLAQTFLVDESGLEGGVYLSKVDLFFQSKDAEIPVSLDIRTVVNGTPTQVIVPLSKFVKEPAEVFISEDASTPTTFTFESPGHPIQTRICTVLTSDSNNYKTFVLSWVRMLLMLPLW